MEQFACRAAKSQFFYSGIVLWILHFQLSILKEMSTLSLSELLGLKVYDSTGTASGRVREAALVPQEDRSRISALIVKTRAGSRTLPCSAVSGIDGGVIRASTTAAEWSPANGTEGQFFLSRDLLDQQVIDVHGRKVVRVNDVDFYQETAQNRVILKIEGVDVGARGAIRRLLKGVIPLAVLRILVQRIPPREIPWEFVDLIETDPARRVKLKISHERLAKLLEFGENTAAGRMTTEYIALPVTATAHDAIEAMRNFGGRMESMSTIFLIDSNGTLAGTVPVVKIAMAKPETPLLALHQEPLIYSRANAKEKEYAELFDKYNLLTLPVVDDHNRLVGVITPDDVINMLRAKL